MCAASYMNGACAEGAVRQYAQSSANYRLVRLAACHPHHRLARRLQEDPASSEASHYRGILYFCGLIPFNIFYINKMSKFDQFHHFVLIQKLVTDLQSGKTLLNSDDSEDE